jgi:hypothetical protein
MAKTTAPLLSFGAAGQIAKTAVYATWRGRPYVRRHVIPANPQSASQTETRTLFAWLNSVWKAMGSLGIAPWDRFATGQAFVGRNAFIGQNVAAMKGDTDLANMVFSPGATGGLAPLTFSAANGTGSSVCTFTTPTPPSGWTLQAVIAMAVEEQNPQSGILFTTTAGEDTTDPKDTVTLTLSAGTYRIGGWTRWAKADGSIAYGPSLSDSAVVS